MTKELSWKEMFPEGRYIFYEGDDPEGFMKEIKERFGFDVLDQRKPEVTQGWFMAGLQQEDWKKDWKEFHSLGFVCPAEHLDAIYTEYPMGS